MALMLSMVDWASPSGRWRSCMYLASWPSELKCSAIPPSSCWSGRYSLALLLVPIHTETSQDPGLCRRMWDDRHKSAADLAKLWASSIFGTISILSKCYWAIQTWKLWDRIHVSQTETSIRRRLPWQLHTSEDLYDYHSQVMVQASQFQHDDCTSYHPNCDSRLRCEMIRFLVVLEDFPTRPKLLPSMIVTVAQKSVVRHAVVRLFAWIFVVHWWYRSKLGSEWPALHVRGCWRLRTGVCFEDWSDEEKMAYGHVTIQNPFGNPLRLRDLLVLYAELHCASPARSKRHHRRK